MEDEIKKLFLVQCEGVCYNDERKSSSFPNIRIITIVERVLFGSAMSYTLSAVVSPCIRNLSHHSYDMEIYAVMFPEHGKSCRVGPHRDRMTDIVIRKGNHSELHS